MNPREKKPMVWNGVMAVPKDKNIPAEIWLRDTRIKCTCCETVHVTITERKS